MENYLIKCPNCGNDVSVALEFPITTNFSQKCNRCNATITGSCSWNMHTGSVSFSSVKFYKKVVCPNCGQIASNNKNCEHCGSLLVRFPWLGIDLSDTTYLTNDQVFPGLIEGLNVFYKYFDKVYDFSSARSYPAVHLYYNREQFPGHPSPDDEILYLTPTADESELEYGRLRFTGFNINVSAPIIRDNIKNLACYPLVTVVEQIIDDPMMGMHYTEHCIDCGKDAEGTARIVSDIIRNVFKTNNVRIVTEESDLEEVIPKAQSNSFVRNNLFDFIKTIAYLVWCLLVVVAILVLLIKWIF